MEPRAHYFVVGLFVIGLGTLTVLGALWLSASQHTTVYQTYVTYMDESVSGLSKNGPVKFNGVTVGSVDNIQINPQNSQEVRLELSIEEGTPINQSTRAMLMTQGITGVMYVGLKAGAATAPPLEKKPEEVYPVILSEPSVLVEVGTALRKMTEAMRSISEGFKELLNDNNQKAVQEGLKNLNTTLQDSQAALQNMTQQVLPSLVNTMGRFDRFLNNAEPLVSTLQDNPSALVRGKSAATLGPGENK